MKSISIIFGLCVILGILSFVDVIPDGIAGPAMLSFILMDLFGFFKKDKTAIQEELAAAKKKPAAEYEPGKTDAVIYTKDKDGNEGTVIITHDGEVYVKGEPPVDVVNAALLVKDAVKVHGAEEVARELEKQLKEGGYLQ